MTACNVFPKVSGDCAYESEWNCMYIGGVAGYSVVDATLENAMNVTRLQFCIGVTDIPHDYMIVDSFTDADGYNNSICAASTTSTYCCPAALTAYYYNCCCCATKIQTLNTCFALPVKSVYLDYDKYGTGTVVYHVIKASDGTCLCCNLVPKCFYTMSTCCCCLRFEIIHCSGAMSCIKSYAIAVGV